MYFESHAHYDDKRFDADRHKLFSAMEAAGVDYIVNSASDVESSTKSIEFGRQYDFLYAAVGVHPHEAKSLDEDKFCLLEKLCSEKKVVAVGEIGLDYHYDNSPRDIQVKWFSRQLELAKKNQLPVIIHARDAAQQTFDMLKAANLSGRNGRGAGVIHCYSGSTEMAVKYVKMGYFIGVGGVITYSGGKKLAEVVEHIPITNILIETDSPYLSPVPHRGKRNDSQNLKYICQKISEIKQTTHEETAKITMENGLRFFDIN